MSRNEGRKPHQSRLEPVHVAIEYSKYEESR